MAEPTILIIGAGTFGTSTAYHLSQRYKDPSRVTTIDRAPSPPEPSAAIDTNRIIRTDYANPLYCDLACEAIHDWFWKLELGEYFHKVGWLMLDEVGSDRADKIRTTLESRGSTQTQDVDLDGLVKRWECLEGTQTKGFEKAYFNPEAGWCEAAAATKSIMDAAVKRGVQRVTASVKELLLDESGKGVRGIRTDDGKEFVADKVILAAGAWTSSLLSPIEDQLNIGEADRIERQVRATGAVSAYYKMSDAEINRIETSRMPVSVYGQVGEVVPPSHKLPYLRYCNGQGTFTNTVSTKSGAKISVPPSDQSQYAVPEGLKQETEEAITSKLMPSFTKAKRPDYWRICWDAVTPTDDWLMCKHPHPSLSNLFLAVGGSFHSYKFLPIAGKFMSNILEDKSNGVEKDKTWRWKEDAVWKNHQGNSALSRELRDLDSRTMGVSARTHSKL
ncbi:FAD/NAD(P)-binding domain-containing protein [Polyplosphaeria fusca]|uniref:FAD/NAD(P)-binding domain-containing protein n=1 Tax=Polyplosphaeria fusca TaxID=682080 RepID=A0A9P4V1B4_9PLEO|nr:FAD/NAD(P)-binding domain-containing protein [Polyplosphaeria fusca]